MNESVQMRHALAVIVPCYNAGSRLQPVVSRLIKDVEHVIVVDDGSTDQGITDIETMIPHLVRFPINRGKGHAMLEGFRTALSLNEITCAAIVDADGQHDPKELPKLFNAVHSTQADLVIGSRCFDEKQVPLRSRFGNKLTAFLTRCLYGQMVTDTQSGYRLHSRRFLEDIVQTLPGGRYETEMAILVKALSEGYRIISVPIQTIYETGNPTSHFHRVRDSIRIYRTLLKGAFNCKRSIAH